MGGHIDGHVRNGDSERIPDGDDIVGSVQQSSNQPVAVGMSPARPGPAQACALLARAARESAVNPNIPPDGLVGVIFGTVGVAGVAVEQASLA